MAGADFRRLEGWVEIAHLIDVGDPNPENWRYIHRGPVQKATALLGNKLSSCPIRAVVEQTQPAYVKAVYSGEPLIDLCRRRAKGKHLDFLRVIVPQRDESGRVAWLRVGIDYEPPRVRPRQRPEPFRA